MIHGGIDGFSRLLVFLRASSNNRKETVLEQFVGATNMYGIPSRVRVDNGGENNDLCHLMELLRGRGRGSAIRGTSVHNQRIERAWLDMWNGATNLYFDLFHFLEERESLNINSNSHMWALHYVFLPRLNRELRLFADQWNNHGLRTSHHETPLQLFVGGAIDRSRASLTAMEDIFGTATPTDDAVQSAHTVFHDEWNDVDLVHIPDIPCPLDEVALSTLQQTIDPLAESNDMGMDVFLKVMEIIREHS